MKSGLVRQPQPFGAWTKVALLHGWWRTNWNNLLFYTAERADCKSRDPPPTGQKDEDHGQLMAKQSLRLLGKHWCLVETGHCDDWD